MTGLIDLTKVSAPAIVENVDFDTLLEQNKNQFKALHPDYDAVALDLDSDTAAKLLQVSAYRETGIRARINAAAKATLLQYATEEDLDARAADFELTRKVITEADPSTTPPTPAVMETDDELRRRCRLKWEAITNAGSKGAYEFHVFNASTDIKDVSITSPNPGEVLVTILSKIGDGNADSDLIDTVITALDADTVRPMTDTVIVQSASISTYTVEATLTFYPGPDAQTVLQSAQSKIESYVTEQHLLGRDITLSGIYAALHQPGVQNVQLTFPVNDIANDDISVSYCNAITLTSGGQNV